MPQTTPSVDPAGEVTLLLRRWSEKHDREALEAALPHVIGELRQLARHYLSLEAPGHTLQPTALVHEAYLRLLEGRVGKVRSRHEFFAFTARLMRQILVDHARTRGAEKRGGGTAKADLAEALKTPVEQRLDPETLLAVHELLGRLGEIDPRLREVTELRYFVGLTVKEVAQVLDTSVTGVERHWRAARCWLAHEFRHAADPKGGKDP